jgi:hypothetical protein
MRLPDELSLRRDVRASLGRHRGNIVVPDWQQGAAGRAVDAAQLSFDRFTQVLQQVEPVGDLPRLVRAVSRALRVETASIAAVVLPHVILLPTASPRMLPATIRAGSGVTWDASPPTSPMSRCTACCRHALTRLCNV